MPSPLETLRELVEKEGLPVEPWTADLYYVLGKNGTKIIRVRDLGSLSRQVELARLIAAMRNALPDLLAVVAMEVADEPDTETCVKAGEALDRLEGRG